MGGEGAGYATVSIPTAIAEEIDKLIGELGYWPSRSAFVREACLEKMFKEKDRARGLRPREGGEPPP